MDLHYNEKRASDSPFIDRVWRSESETGGAFVSLADIHSSLVVSRFDGKTWLTFRGPETRWSPAWAPPEAEWLGIMLKPGVSLSPLPPSRLRDRQDLTFEGSRRRGVSWGGMCLEIPDFSNAEGLVDRLVRAGLLHEDPLVAEVLAQRPILLSERSVQRRFLHATGVTPITAFTALTGASFVGAWRFLSQGERGWALFSLVTGVITPTLIALGMTALSDLAGIAFALAGLVCMG